MRQPKLATFGEIMLRLAPPNHLRLGQSDTLNINFGGGEANVAVSLSNFGKETAFVSRLPENPLGTAARNVLRSYGVDTIFMEWGGKRLGTYYLERGAINRKSQVIYDRENSAFATIGENTIDWNSVFSNVDWFHWTGITPAISESAAKCLLQGLKVAQNKGVYISVDLNYRSKLWNYGKTPDQVMPQLVSFCDLILANEEDAEKHFGIAPECADDESTNVHERYHSVCKALLERFPACKKIVITLRESISASHNNWSGLLYDGTEFHSGSTYQLTHIVDRVGAGDSFMAGLIYGLMENMPDSEALEFAIAASALKHTISGDFNLVSVEEVMNLVNGDSTGRVNR